MLLLVLASCNNQGTTPTETDTTVQSGQRIGGRCETCELIYVDMPQSINAVDTSAAWQDGTGEKLIVTGTVYKSDKKTPAPNIILYYWQTDNKGEYADKPGLNPKARRHGYIRGWVKTDKQGKYTIYTIRPASYPNGRNPQHIHMLVKEPQLPNEYYIDDILFEDDPMLTEQVKNQLEKKGGSGLISPVMQDGVQRVNRDIILGMNISGYPE